MYILIQEEVNVKTSIQAIWGASYIDLSVKLRRFAIRHLLPRQNIGFKPANRVI